MNGTSRLVYPFVDTLVGPRAEPVSIGFGFQDADPRFFPGLPAEVRIDDEELDEAAVAAIVAGEVGPTLLQPGDADQDLKGDNPTSIHDLAVAAPRDGGANRATSI
jgi:hypothetical protein